jgi:hypothetical protein
MPKLFRRNILARCLVILLVLIAAVSTLPAGEPNSLHSPTVKATVIPYDLIASPHHFFTRTRWNRTFKLIRGYPIPD